MQDYDIFESNSVVEYNSCLTVLVWPARTLIVAGVLQVFMRIIISPLLTISLGAHFITSLTLLEQATLGLSTTEYNMEKEMSAKLIGVRWVFVMKSSLLIVGWNTESKRPSLLCLRPCL